MTKREQNQALAHCFLAGAVSDGIEERRLAWWISDHLGDSGVQWSPQRVRDYLEIALQRGWCYRLPICRSSGRPSNVYYRNPYHAIKWLDANPDWAVQEADRLPEVLGVSAEMIDQCRAGSSVYVGYGAKLAVLEPGLLLAGIHERCAASLGLPATWAAHLSDGEDVYGDYRAKAGDVIEFCEDLILTGYVTVNPEPARPPSPYAYHFDEEMKEWHFRFPGDPSWRYRNLEGLQMYARLLKWGTPMSGADLYFVDEALLGKRPKWEPVFTKKDLV